MEWARMGDHGLRVSRLCLGTMMFGSRMDEQASREMLDTALDLGVGFVDTGDVYPFPPAPQTWGRTEEIIGRWVRDKREQVVIATKLGNRSGHGPNDAGGSRRHVTEACEASLRRLGVDAIDLLYVHNSRIDAPIEETVASLERLVADGKVHNIGLSNWSAWQVAVATEAISVGQRTPIAALSPQYSLLRRVDERDLLPFAQHKGIGVVPYYALAGGLLSGRFARTATLPAEHRMLRAGFDAAKGAAQVYDVCEAVQRIAAQLGVPASRLALAWVLHQPAVVSSILGASTPAQLRDTVLAAELKLPDEVLAELDAVSAVFT